MTSNQIQKTIGYIMIILGLSGLLLPALTLACLDLSISEGYEMFIAPFMDVFNDSALGQFFFVLVILNPIWMITIGYFFVKKTKYWKSLGSLTVLITIFSNPFCAILLIVALVFLGCNKPKKIDNNTQ